MKKRAYLIPLSYLLQVKSIQNINLNSKGAEHLKKTYDKEVRLNIYNSLQEFDGRNILNYNFQKLIEEAGLMGTLNYSNKQIYDYLMSFKRFMENEEFGLLTDDKPTSFL